MDFSSFLASLGTSFLLFLVLMLLFAWLSSKPENHVIYYPNRILKGLSASSRTRNPFSWIKEAISSTEDDIISRSGVDSAVYFVFLSTAFTMLIVCCIPLLPSLLPISITDHSIRLENTTSNGTFSELDKFSMGHIGVNKIWGELEGYKKKLTTAETVYGQSKTITRPEGMRPTNRIGFLGLYGKKVGTIDHCNEKIDKLNSKLEAEQKITLKDKQLSSAIIFFTSRVSAASAAQSLHARMVDTWTVMDAPEARQLIWSNLSLSYYEREVRKYIVYFVVALIIFFFMIPIGIISAFTTLENLMKLLPFIKPVIKIGIIRTVLEAYLPQIALIVFMALLPTLLMFLSKAEGIPSESHAVRAASGKYFYFIVLNVFIGVTLGGALFENFTYLEKHPNETVPTLARNLPENATFFLTYVALQFFVGYGLELSRLVPLIIFHLKKRYLCKTEAEVKEAWTPGDFQYATRFPADMLILTITLCYSVIAPLIIPFGAIYFGLGWLVLRNQALKVYVPTFESYGRMWPHIHSRFLAALVLYQLTMVGYFALKLFSYGVFVIPLPILSVIFAFVCNKRFVRFFQCTTLEVACHELKETPNMERLYKSFLPPSLNSDKLDTHHFGDA